MTNALQHIPKGKIIEEPFVDYGATRNRVLELAKIHYNPVFTLMLSADETVINPKDLLTFLTDFRYAYGKQHNAYPVVMNTGGEEFDSVRVARVDGMWRYVGRVHEYLTSPEKAWVDLYRFVPEVKVRFQATDGPRRFQSQYFIIKILLEEIEKTPKDARTMMYLGSTYATVGNHTESYYWWGRLAEVTTENGKYEALVTDLYEYIAIFACLLYMWFVLLS